MPGKDEKLNNLVGVNLDRELHTKLDLMVAQRIREIAGEGKVLPSRSSVLRDALVEYIDKHLKETSWKPGTTEAPSGRQQ